MRSVTLSCITFQWMSTHAHWSFQAVGDQVFSPSILEPVISTSTSSERGASVWASLVPKPQFLRLLLFFSSFCQKPHLLAAALSQPVLICHQHHQCREVTQSHFSDRLDELCTLSQSDSCRLCHASFVSFIVQLPMILIYNIVKNAKTISWS